MIPKKYLPEHLEALLDLPWKPETSREVDLWLNYLALEFEGGQQ